MLHLGTFPSSPSNTRGSRGLYFSLKLKLLMEFIMLLKLKFMVLGVFSMDFGVNCTFTPFWMGWRMSQGFKSYRMCEPLARKETTGYHASPQNLRRLPERYYCWSSSMSLIMRKEEMFCIFTCPLHLIQTLGNIFPCFTVLLRHVGKIWIYDVPHVRTFNCRGTLDDQISMIKGVMLKFDRQALIIKGVLQTAFRWLS